jgi:hypothetical protein
VKVFFINTSKNFWVSIPAFSKLCSVKCQQVLCCEELLKWFRVPTRVLVFFNDNHKLNTNCKVFHNNKNLENDGHTTFIICSVLLQFWSSHILRCTKCFLIGICIICNIIDYWSTLNYYVMIYNFTPLWSHLHINCHCCVSSIKFPVFRSVQISFSIRIYSV